MEFIKSDILLIISNSFNFWQHFYPAIDKFWICCIMNIFFHSHLRKSSLTWMCIREIRELKEKERRNYILRSLHIILCKIFLNYVHLSFPNRPALMVVVCKYVKGVQHKFITSFFIFCARCKGYPDWVFTETWSAIVNGNDYVCNQRSNTLQEHIYFIIYFLERMLLYISSD